MSRRGAVSAVSTSVSKLPRCRCRATTEPGAERIGPLPDLAKAFVYLRSPPAGKTASWARLGPGDASRLTDPEGPCGLDPLLPCHWRPRFEARSPRP